LSEKETGERGATLLKKEVWRGEACIGALGEAAPERGFMRASLA
jgi:hypothetical protein